MAFGDQIYRQTNITTSKCHECETSFIKMPIACHPPPSRKRKKRTKLADKVCSLQLKAQ
ncbi:hypothetical protein GCM10009410_09110 [Shewanella ulleungensis]|uniref:Uncharacterized protein n=1 Tax=Shewanella ulleungensis TaxID=2282699 RepID=A0ABQ2QFG2_9GAMM|nr:hypothetical protein GCM10009410_09110 [Shewanella ulleungensis]